MTFSLPQTSSIYCILSGINFITAKYNFLPTEMEWQSGQDLHFQFNKTSENDF